jgi:hypothetical protein
MIPMGGEGDLAQLVEREDLGAGDVAVPCSGAPTLTSATARATSAEAMGWTSMAGSRTVSSSAVSDSTASMNSKNCVARTIEYGTGPALRGFP